MSEVHPSHSLRGRRRRSPLLVVLPSLALAGRQSRYRLTFGWLLAMAVTAFAGWLIIALSAPAPASSARRDVVLLHGWRGNPGSWDSEAARYRAAGDTVHQLDLPEEGDQAGDTARNAASVADYIADHHLTNVKLDGHSLGGWLALYVALGCRPSTATSPAACDAPNPAVTSVVLRDTGTGCFFKRPGDQCPGSELLAVLSASTPSPLPVLNLSSKSTQLPQVDCTRVFSGLSHAQFQSDVQVSAAAVGWPDVSPCSAPATVTSTPRPTVTATPAPTAAPTATPSSCSWLARLLGWC
ncbi:MAG: esterase/lipase family protein [Dehalococcoidia bacterium]